MHRTARIGRLLVTTLTVLAAVVLPYAASVPAANATTVIVTPSSLGTGGWTATGGTKVEAVAVDDASTKYIQENGTGRQTFFFSGAGVPAGSTINSVTLFAVARWMNNPSSIELLVRSGATNYLGSNEPLTNSFATYSYVMSTNPVTSSAWTVAEVNAGAIEFGIRKNAAAGRARVTYLYLEVDYTARRGSAANVVGPFSVVINQGDATTPSRDVTLTLEAGGETAWAMIDNDWRFDNGQWVVFNSQLASGSKTPLYLSLLIIFGFASSGFWLSKFAAHKVHLLVAGLILGGLLLSQPVAFGGNPTLDVPWQLAEGSGEKTVYVQFYTRSKEGGSSSPMVEDTILYTAEDVNVGGEGPTSPSPTVSVTPTPSSTPVTSPIPTPIPVIRRPVVSPVMSPSASVPASPTVLPDETDDGGFWQWLTRKPVAKPLISPSDSVPASPTILPDETDDGGFWQWVTDLF